MNIKKSEKGQVWIETVLYTLIALILIGLVLGFVMPKIQQQRDKIIVEQSISVLNSLDEKINSAAQDAGNVRIFPFTIRKGSLIVNGTSDEILIVLDGLVKPYSQPGVVVPNGRVGILSIQQQKSSTTILILNYTGIYEIYYNGDTAPKVFNAAQTGYTLSIADVGINPATRLTMINITETS